MVQLILVKVTAQRTLHMVTTERRECNASPGMMCAARVPGGSLGRLKVQVWVDYTFYHWEDGQ